MSYITLNTATLFQRTKYSAKGKKDNHTMKGELGRRERIHVVVFRLSPCSECSLCSFGNFPGVRSIKADVSELNVGSIVLGDQE